MSPSPLDSYRPDPDGANARSWWLTAVFRAVVAILAAFYGSMWTAIAAVLLAAATLLAGAQGYRAFLRPTTAVVAVARLVVAAAVLAIAAVPAGWLHPLMKAISR